MSEFTYAEAEVMARRYVGGGSFDKDEFEDALGEVMNAIELIEGCGGKITFTPPLAPAGGVYGEERNWLMGRK